MKSFANTKLNAACSGLLVLMVVVLRGGGYRGRGLSGSDGSQFKPRNSEKRSG
jgi:hypothetical protein